MSVHDLKTHPQFFREVFLRRKNFEIRKNDRGFAVGDVLHLSEFDPCRCCSGHGRLRIEPDDWCACDKCPAIPNDPRNAVELKVASGGYYTGRRISMRVKYILTAEQFHGLREGFVCMALEECDSNV